MSDFGRLRSYGRFLIPVHALVWTASNSWCVITHYGCHWRHKQQWAETARAVHNRAAACVAAGGGIFENQL